MQKIFHISFFVSQFAAEFSPRMHTNVSRRKKPRILNHETAKEKSKKQEREFLFFVIQFVIQFVCIRG
jgi:hypothetical protein